MRRELVTIVSVAAALGVLAGSVQAQSPPPVVANPHYVSIPLEIMVNRPAAEVWKRVGKYCDIGEWLPRFAPCTITSGKDGEFGAVRSAGAGEVLVGKTELSYTYTQPVRVGQTYNLYHGTLEARPVTATTSKLLYTLVFALGAALAALAGAMAGPIYVVEIGMGDSMLIKTFVVIVIGGIGSIRGAFVAAIIVGMVDTFGRIVPAQLGLPTALAEMAIYILMATVLFWKPAGLFSARA